jgi:hypothetical protein
MFHRASAQRPSGVIILFSSSTNLKASKQANPKETRIMNDLVLLLNVACGHPLSTVPEGRARRLRLMVSGLMAALVFAALWGLAAGSYSAPLALANLYKVPMVILLSAVSAVPAALLAWKLTRAKEDWTEIVLKFVSGIFAGTLVLAVLAPLVALYYHSSVWAGPLLGSATVFIALAAGAIVSLRSAQRDTDSAGGSILSSIPVVVFLAIQLAALMQLVVLVAPIFPERTIFSEGVDQASSYIEPMSGSGR